MADLTFVYPGDLNTRTGGYRYDKRLIEELRAMGQAHVTGAENNGGENVDEGNDNGVIDSKANDDGKSESWEVELISLQGDYPFPDDEQLKIAASQFTAIEDNAIVVVDGLAYSVMPTIIASQAHRLRLVALIHHPLALETGLNEMQMQALRTKETQALQHAVHVVTTSALTADSLADYAVPSHKISAIAPGTDSAPLAQGSANEVLNLLCVATLTQRKAHDVLLEALAKIKLLPWHLYCAGSTERDPQTYESLLAKRKTLALDQQVTFLGELDDKALEQQFLHADVFVLASYHEGYGMVLSEAIAHGLPIVCTDAGAMSQTVPEGAGMLVPAGDANALANALKSVISNTTQRAKLQSAARKARMHTRSWKQAAAEFSSLLQQLSDSASK